MISHLEDNKRLAKNTIVLYFRTIIVMFVSLYVSRIILTALGVNDYGIYNVVGSIVVLFSFLSRALVQASQRFITFELGSGVLGNVNKVFNVCIITQLSIVILVLALAETIGLWFLNTGLNIPITRMIAANWVYQLSILTFCIGVLRVPYDATIIAYEKMSFFAYANIGEALLKLVVALFVKFFFPDKLIAYGILLCVVSMIMYFSYRYYCRHHFESCKFRYEWDILLFKKLLSFSGWALFGNGANVATQNGFVFLINIFYGVTVNAAMGIANQVSGVMSSFVASFQTSFQPQIVTSYAKNDILHLNNLIFNTSKFSFVLIFIPALILIFNMPLALHIWLKEVPDYAVSFCQLILICVIIDATTGAYNCAIMASEKIKYYQLAISASFLFDLFVSYFLIKIGISPRYILISRIFTRGIINMIIGLYFLKKMVNFSISHYLIKVMAPIFVILLLCIIPTLYLSIIFKGWSFILVSSFTLILTGSFASYYFLLSRVERYYILKFFKYKLSLK